MSATVTQPLSGARRWVTVAAVSVALFMVTLDNLIVIVGLSSIRRRSAPAWSRWNGPSTHTRWPSPSL